MVWQVEVVLLMSVTVRVTVCGVPTWLQLNVLGDTVVLCKPQAAVLLLLTAAAVSVAEFPERITVAGWQIATGAAQHTATVTTAVAVFGQLWLVTVYEMVVMPGATLVTTPVLLTVAAAVLLLLQVPPPAPSVVSAVVLPVVPVQMLVLPLIVPAFRPRTSMVVNVLTAQPVAITR